MQPVHRDNGPASKKPCAACGRRVKGRLGEVLKVQGKWSVYCLGCAIKVHTGPLALWGAETTSTPMGVTIQNHHARH